MQVTPINFFKGVVKEPEQFYIIHYSSQSLYDADSAGHSPRITSISHGTRAMIAAALRRLVLVEYYNDTRVAKQREQNMKHWPRAWKPV